MPRRPHDEDQPESIIATENDAEDPRTYEHPDADAVRSGELSAAQLAGGGGNVDASEPDAQYPPGRIDNTAPVVEQGEDLRSFVPERRPVNTAATPDYGTSPEE